MKAFFSLCLLGLVAMAAPLCAQLSILQNPSFEEVDLSAFMLDPFGGGPLGPYSIRQPWEVAIPGWEHTSGYSTDVVYFRGFHIGESQMFSLEELAPGSPFEGNYAISLMGGFELSENGNFFGPWIQAAIWQTVTLPTDIEAVQFLTDGLVRAFFNGVELNHTLTGTYGVSANLKPYAGQTGELRFTNLLPREDNWPPLFLDHITFSPSNVPEPAMLGWLGWLALAALGGVRGRRRGG